MAIAHNCMAFHAIFPTFVLNLERFFFTINDIERSKHANAMSAAV